MLKQMYDIHWCEKKSKIVDVLLQLNLIFESFL